MWLILGSLVIAGVNGYLDNEVGMYAWIIITLLFTCTRAIIYSMQSLLTSFLVEIGKGEGAVEEEDNG